MHEGGDEQENIQNAAGSSANRLTGEGVRKKCIGYSRTDQGKDPDIEEMWAQIRRLLAEDDLRRSLPARRRKRRKANSCSKTKKSTDCRPATRSHMPPALPSYPMQCPPLFLQIKHPPNCLLPCHAARNTYRVQNTETKPTPLLLQSPRSPAPVSTSRNNASKEYHAHV